MTIGRPRTLPSQLGRLQYTKVYDAALLRLALDHREQLSETEQETFPSFNPDRLIAKQRSWLQDALRRLDVPEPAANLVSEGAVPKEARVVPVPAARRRLPLSPPGKRGGWKEIA